LMYRCVCGPNESVSSGTTPVSSGVPSQSYKSELMKHFMKCKCFFAVSDGMLLSAIAEEVF
ncbi:MAG: hypothetical protein ACLVJ4_02345, partial [Mediterraneibacter sp.]